MGETVEGRGRGRGHVINEESEGTFSARETRGRGKGGGRRGAGQDTRAPVVRQVVPAHSHQQQQMEEMQQQQQVMCVTACVCPPTSGARPLLGPAPGLNKCGAGAVLPPAGGCVGGGGSSGAPYCSTQAAPAVAGQMRCIFLRPTWSYLTKFIFGSACGLH